MKINSEDFEVGQNEMKKSCGGVLTSGGMNPCIAIAIYNPYNKCAYMIHDPSFVMSNNLNERIQKIIEDLGDQKRLIIQVAGNSTLSTEDDEPNNDILENRSYVEKSLQKFFKKSQIKIQWAEPDMSTVLTLNTETGKFDVDFRALGNEEKESSDPDDYDSNGNWM